MEEIYQYIWKFRLAGKEFLLPDGRCLSVENPGVLNKDAGPDFYNSKIWIDGVQWIGNVEVHVKASDWFRHHHDSDRNYDNVILHVVAHDDCEIKRRDGSLIPTLVLKPSPSFLKFISSISDGIGNIRCHPYLHRLSDLVKSDWMGALAVERIETKSEHLFSILERTNSNWEQTAFSILARALGFGLNSEPMENVAISLPINTLHHHSDDLFQLEALVFGQAGLLDPSIEIFNDYYQRLCREYYFLAKKYGLRPGRGELFKMARTRPQNFPHRRLAYLAAACREGFSVMKKLIEAPLEINAIIDIFRFDVSDYWRTHFNFHESSVGTHNSMSDSSLRLILINAAAPLLYAYGMIQNNQDLKDKSFYILESLPPEENVIIRNWRMMNVKASSAFESQALIHLRKNYCDLGKCLDCRFGHQMMRSVISEPEEQYNLTSETRNEEA